MSSQKGNATRTRPQKYKNKTSFRNDMHDSSKQTKELNCLDIHEVCKTCKDVIAWKIKYKKYKILSQPKTCLKCHEKRIKLAYHTICEPCGKELGICRKCREAKDLIPATVTEKDREKILLELADEIKLLPERKRRSFHRYLDKLHGVGKKKRRKKASVAENGNENDCPEENEVVEEPINEKAVSPEDYVEKVRLKLARLGKGIFELDDDESCDDDSDSDSE